MRASEIRAAAQCDECREWTEDEGADACAFCGSADLAWHDGPGWKGE